MRTVACRPVPLQCPSVKYHGENSWRLCVRVFRRSPIRGKSLLAASRAVVQSPFDQATGILSIGELLSPHLHQARNYSGLTTYSTHHDNIPRRTTPSCQGIPRFDISQFASSGPVDPENPLDHIAGLPGVICQAAKPSARYYLTAKPLLCQVFRYHTWTSSVSNSKHLRLGERSAGRMVDRFELLCMMIRRTSSGRAGAERRGRFV